MSNRTMVESTKAFGVKQVLRYIDKNPDKNIPKLLSWAPCYNFGQKAKETPRSEIACLPD